MRPNIDIGWEIHGSVKAIADARYNGDLDLAYREVLNRGLTYSAIPGNERIEAGEITNVQFIPTEGEGVPLVFHQFLGRSTDLYSVGHGPYKTFEIDEIREHLTTVSRYDGVGIENAAFGLRRPGGSWVGWGLGDFVEALSQPIKRYRDTDFDELSHEEAGVVFNVGNDHVILRGRHLPEDGLLGNVHIEILAEARPVRLDSSLEAVIDEFDAQIVNATELSDHAHTGPIHETISVDPIEYLTYMNQRKEWIYGFLIENPFRSEKLHHNDPDIKSPAYVAMYLSDHELMDEAHSSEYWVKEYSVTSSRVSNMTLFGTWSRSE
jgi:hypothetical protein